VSVGCLIVVTRNLVHGVGEAELALGSFQAVENDVAWISSNVMETATNLSITSSNLSTVIGKALLTKAEPILQDSETDYDSQYRLELLHIPKTGGTMLEVFVKQHYLGGLPFSLPVEARWEEPVESLPQFAGEY
jgi:hypothetical protein